MTITLTKNKKEKIKSSSKQLLTPLKICQGEIASVIGNIVASFTTVPYGTFHYRNLEKDKLEALKISKYNCDAYLTLSNNSISALRWWVSNMEQACIYRTTTEPDLTIYTDTTLTG